jgi:hypothetical protein
MTILRDVTSHLVGWARSVEELIRSGDRFLGKTRLSGTTVVELSGAALAEGATNTIRVRRLPGARISRRNRPAEPRPKAR